MTLRCDLIIPPPMNFGTRVLLPEEQIPYRERQEDVVYALENAFLRVRDELPFPVDFRKLQITERPSVSVTSPFEWQKSHMIMATDPDEHLLWNLHDAAVANPALSLIMYGNAPLPRAQEQIWQKTIPNVEDRLFVRTYDCPDGIRIQSDIKRALQFICGKHFG